MSVYVVFFGGYQSTQDQINAWLGSARATKPDIDFSAFPYPSGAGAGGNSAVTTFKQSGRYDAAVAAIQASGADPVYIVGHSSGCAIANAVDAGLKDHKKVVLVALDGYAPDGNQLARSSTQVWSAAWRGATSLHYDDLKKLVGGRLKVYKAAGCTTLWALHFSLVNAAATDGVVKSIATGYAGCQANLVWL